MIGVIPTFGDGVIKSADGPLHVHRIFAMTTLLQTGDLWPRWVPWFHLGYGYPVFNFYPPGVFHLGGILGLLGLPIPLAFTLVSALAWTLGSVGVYALARHFLPGYGALLAAMLWAYAPSRLYEVWHQGSLPQMMSSALVPWVFWALVQAARLPSRRSLLAVGFLQAGIILTHQPVTLLAGLFIAPAALLLPVLYGWRDRKTLPRRWAAVWGGLVLSAGLAAIFLLPLAAELRYVQAAENASDVIPYLISNFLQPSELFSQPMPMDLTDLRFELPTTFGLLNGLLGALGLLALARWRRYTVAALLALALAFNAFMLLEISLPLWERIPFLAQLRFPARLLRVGAVFIALAGGASLLLPVRWRLAGLGAGLALALVCALPLVYPNQQFVNWENLSVLDEIRMEEVEHNWGTTSYDEFNPIWGEKPGWDPAVEPEEYVADPLRIVVNRLDMIRQWPDLQVEQVDSASVRVRVASARPVRFRQFYFPGWTATLNGQPVEVYPETELGQITVDVPEGEHIIALAYTGTTAQKLGALVTLASLGVSAVLMATSRQRRTAETRKTDAEAGALPPRPAAGIAAATVVFALVNTIYIAPQTLWFRHRSPADNPVYMQTPVRVSFGEAFELLGYTLEQTTTAPGDLLTVTLYWRALYKIEDEYRPVVQLVNLSQTAAWAVSEPFFPGGGKTVGYTPDRFASDVHVMRVFKDAPSYAGRISVQMLHAATNEPLRLPDGRDRLILEPLIRIRGRNEALPLALSYRFDEAVELVCARVKRNGDRLDIQLGWSVGQPLRQDVTTFVHGLDTSGRKITQNDARPLGADYPSSLWLPGQNLLAVHSLPWHEAIAAIAVGLYTPDRRLAVTRNGQSVPDNRVILPLSHDTCSR
ncbi:MAG: 6-pyruvoyl-tetrahydropterin synthase-related protein [Aggregatilineales bacterium]